MSFNISEILEKLKAIEGFANKVTETKRLADELAENLARLKIEVNKTINDSFSQIADQIETLRSNMESMERVHQGAPAVEPVRAPTPTPTPPPKAATVTPKPEPTPMPKATPAPPPSKTAPTLTPTPKPTPAPTARTAPPVTAPPPSAEPMDEEVVVLLQKKDRLKASLTDLRFDYMRGYIPEPEYKSKEAELDGQLEELEREIASKK